MTAPSANGGGGGLPQRRRFGADQLFRAFTTSAGSLVLVIIAAIAVFLVIQAMPSLADNEANFFTETDWSPDASPASFGIAATVFGTIYTATLALIMSVPVAIGIALCLTHYAPRRLAVGLSFVIDLLAAVPSVVFGLWGRDYFFKPVTDLSAWLHANLGWIPIFGSGGPYGKSILLGSIVLAIMILPIVTSLSREVFLQTPSENQEAALALGATKWEMIRTAVLPYGKAGIIASVMLGLGRALGETIALALTLGTVYKVDFDLLGINGVTIASNIANKFNEAGDNGRSALIASGLVLFAITLVVNMTARAIIYRRREFVGGSA